MDAVAVPVPAAQPRVEVAAQEPAPSPVLPVLPVEPSAPAPTWSTIYGRYFGPGTEGGCGRTRACHAAVMYDADSTYDWLKTRGYISGPQSALASKTNSCLRWFGGTMPPRGKPDEQAARDVAAWVASGAAND